MSCFVVCNEHINALLTWAIAEGVYLWDRAQKQNVKVTEENADSFGQTLADENCRSYNYRYDDENVDALDYAFKPFPILLTALEVIRACHCFDYQACESPDWPETAAAQIIRELVDYAAGRNPELDKVDVWEIRPDTMTKLTNHLEKLKGKRRA